jgi:hypothetical protein
MFVFAHVYRLNAVHLLASVHRRWTASQYLIYRSSNRYSLFADTDSTTLDRGAYMCLCIVL